MEEEERQKGEGGKGSVCVLPHTFSPLWYLYPYTTPKATFLIPPLKNRG